MKKRLLSIALALVMCLGLMAVPGAADYTEVMPCKYVLVGDLSEGYGVKGYGGREDFIDKTVARRAKRYFFLSPQNAIKPLGP